MVAGNKINKKLCRKASLAGLREVADIYSWIDEQLGSHSKLAGRCEACGKCCDFDAYDHRLYLSPPELMYLAAGLDVEKLRPMTTSRCPYNIDGKCSVYEHRFAGCRIFCCRADADFQSRLTEEALERLKSICLKYEIPYIYTNLATALESCQIRK